MAHRPRQNEEQRLLRLQGYETQARGQGYRFIAGVDEVGRGPLAGPVVAAAVILPEEPDLPGIDDSKKLAASKRLKLFDQIKRQAVGIGIAAIKENIIDELNILQATRLAMCQAIAHLQPAPDYLLIDAVTLPRVNIPQQAIKRGDSLSISIAAASIMAKVIRDELMCHLAKRYPHYHFEQHKGYGTPLHLAALRQYGPSPIHRLSFKTGVAARL
jgi:ribonuclease HII